MDFIYVIVNKKLYRTYISYFDGEWEQQKIFIMEFETYDEAEKYAKDNNIRYAKIDC